MQIITLNMTIEQHDNMGNGADCTLVVTKRDGERGNFVVTGNTDLIVKQLRMIANLLDV